MRSLTGALVRFAVDYCGAELNGGAFQGVALLDRGDWI